MAPAAVPKRRPRKTATADDTRAYILRNVDATLWQQVRTKATNQGQTVRWIMLRLLALWASGQVEL